MGMGWGVYGLGLQLGLGSGHRFASRESGHDLF